MRTHYTTERIHLPDFSLVGSEVSERNTLLVAVRKGAVPVWKCTVTSEALCSVLKYQLLRSLLTQPDIPYLISWMYLNLQKRLRKGFQGQIMVFYEWISGGHLRLWGSMIKPRELCGTLPDKLPWLVSPAKQAKVGVRGAQRSVKALRVLRSPRKSPIHAQMFWLTWFWQMESSDYWAIQLVNKLVYCISTGNKLSQ